MLTLSGTPDFTPFWEFMSSWCKKIYHNGKKYIMTSNKCNDIKITSWHYKACQKYIMKCDNTSLHKKYIWHQYVMISTIHHEVKKYIITSILFHDIEVMSWRQKYVVTLKSTSLRQKVHHDMKRIYNIKKCIITSKVRHGGKLYVIRSKLQHDIMMPKGMSWHQKINMTSKVCHDVITSKHTSWCPKVRYDDQNYEKYLNISWRQK